jgi:hypothetical protein
MHFDQGWAKDLLPERDASLLESEWTLRVVALGEPFVKSLLSGDSVHEDACKKMLSHVKRSFGPGATQRTLQKNEVDLKALVDAWPTTAAMNATAFWKLGQRRSTEYEPVLGRLLGNYNQSRAGFLGYRPDFIVSSYIPCSILSAGAADSKSINDAIKREAHVLEFTALDVCSTANIRNYLKGKLRNYVDVVREQ